MSKTRFIVTLLFAFLAGLLLIWAKNPGSSTDPLAFAWALMPGIGISLAVFYISIYLRTTRCGKKHDRATPPDGHTTAPRQRREDDGKN